MAGMRTAFSALAVTAAIVVATLPAGADSPGAVVTPAPATGLAPVQTISVSGVGSKANYTGGDIHECADLPEVGVESCVQLASFNTNASGAFGPLTVTVRRSFDSDSGDPSVNCSFRTCTLFAHTDEKNGHGTLSFVPAAPVGDFNGDHKTDIAIFRPSSGSWYVNGGVTTSWGVSGDIPVPGDYDGDNDVDIAVYRPGSGTWYVLGGAATNWGVNGDVPVPGDYDGDGKSDIAVYRPASGTWYTTARPTSPSTGLRQAPGTC